MGFEMPFDYRHTEDSKITRCDDLDKIVMS